MDAVLNCWEGCGEDVAFHAPSRGSDALTDGVDVKCSECGQPYTLTVDGDGEIDLESRDESSEGDIVSDPDSTNY